MCELIRCIFKVQWFRKVATAIIFDEIRVDEGDLVSEELRKRATQCIRRNVIRQWFGFLVIKNFIYRIPHIWWGLAELLESKLV